LLSTTPNLRDDIVPFIGRGDCRFHLLSQSEVGSLDQLAKRQCICDCQPDVPVIQLRRLLRVKAEPQPLKVVAGQMIDTNSRFVLQLLELSGLEVEGNVN